MLQFLKKSAVSRKNSGSGSNLAHQEENINNKSSSSAAKTTTSDDVIDGAANECKPASDEQALQEAELYWLERWNSVPEVRSRLSRTLLDILAEQSCICYFVQFLETKDALPLVKFWLDVESFKAAASADYARGCDGRNGKGPGHRGLQRSVSSDGYDSLSYLSVDCDSISTYSENAFDDGTTTTDDVDHSCRTSNNCTPIPPALEVVLEEEKRPAEDDDRKQILEVCNLTMRQSLTDDEKTQICASNKLKLEEPNPTPTSKDEGFNSLVNSDAVRIYRKYLVSNSPCYIEMPATILSHISLALCGGSCSEEIFNEAQQYLVDVMEKSYLNAFLESSFYSKYTFEVLSSESLTLKDILCSEMALFYFMEYLEQKRKRHILEFCVTASHFRRSAENSQAQADAVVLYEKYFSLQATCPLNVSDKIRFLVEEGICSQDAGTIKNCFEMPSRVIERFLEKRYFQGFLKSQLYKQYLAELLGKIKTAGVGESTGSSMGILAGRKQIFFSDRNRTTNNQRRGHRKTFSDVTSERSGRAKQFVSSQNTLLAMSDTSFHRKRTNTVGTATGTDIMQIDSRQLYNPDLLWRRNSVAGLTFGRVDALGRYERDFDIVEPPQDDDRWSKNRLKKAMRKLVNLPEDKAQEELAWQVAEMIVKDITSVTMSGGSEGSNAHT
ncbi:hypothetical protein RP20_CCG015621 [Aedes albopictus]|nr:hypothetical protein RP20_CCG015621 [Aedes albopictus]